MEHKSKLINSIEEVSNSIDPFNNYKLTENGALALKSTCNPLIDLFSVIGGSRHNEDIIETFDKAYYFDKLKALKILFYARDIRNNGLGERKVFRQLLKYLVLKDKKVAKLNIENIPFFGRWDDLYCLYNTSLWNDATKLMKEQFELDISNCNDEKNYYKVSLLAKWLKSPNTSSRKSSFLGKVTAKAFDMPEETYRKNLTKVRKVLNIVERNITEKKYENIDYSKVPSLAFLKYKNVFTTKDSFRFDKYMDELINGTTKINTSTLFPYDIVRNIEFCIEGSKEEKLVQLQWNNLPNYVTNDQNFLVMADTSGSMSGTPLTIAISLAIYFAERSKGLFHNNFLTFSKKARLVSFTDEMSLTEKIKYTKSANWNMNTNLDSAFKLVLDSAIKNNIPQEEMPKAIIVITDMEIDEGSYMNHDFSTIWEKKFSDANYELPILVWWNVNARQNTFHGNYKNQNVRFVSGASSKVFTDLCENISKNSVELMEAALNNEVYNRIRVI